MIRMVRNTAKSLMEERTWTTKNTKSPTDHTKSVEFRTEAALSAFESLGSLIRYSGAPPGSVREGLDLGREVAHGLELLEEGGQEEGGEEEDDGPEEHVGDERAIVPTSLPHKLPMEPQALLGGGMEKGGKWGGGGGVRGKG